MNLFKPCFFSVGLMLVGMAGCQPKTNPGPPGGREVPLSGCRVERCEAAEQAVAQLREHSNAHVYTIDGDPATCKLEVFYKPDPESKEETVFTATGDGCAETVREIAEADKMDTGKCNNHHVLAIVVPEYPPKPDDEFACSLSVQCRSESGEKTKTAGHCWRDSKKAKELRLSESLWADVSNRGSTGSPLQSRNLKRGEEATLLDQTFFRTPPAPSKSDRPKMRDLLRYKVTVTCLPVGTPTGMKSQETWNGESK
jgi:hypothetical protein